MESSSRDRIPEVVDQASGSQEEIENLLPIPSRRARSNTTPSGRWKDSNPMKHVEILKQSSKHLKTRNVKNQEHEEEDEEDEEDDEKQTQTNLGGHLRSRSSRSSLKREATSPIYLNDSQISINSDLNNRRVAICMSSRLRGLDSDVGSISSQDEIESNHHHHQASQSSSSSYQEQEGCLEKEKEKKRRIGIGHRNKWTKEETEALVRGCNKVCESFDVLKKKDLKMIINS